MSSPADISRAKRRGEQAIQAFHEASNLDAMTRQSHADDVVYSAEAKIAREKGEALLEPTCPVVVTAGEAVSSDNQSDEIFKGAHWVIAETLENPNSISAGASGQRMNAALAAGVLEPAVDAAVSAQAENSLEKMLCHQMAGAHFTAMRLFKLSADLLEQLPFRRQLQPGEVARLTNAAARMMDVYQAGCLALQKLKTGGTQRVLVQHVNVGAGGQAVVAGRVDRGSRSRGESAESEDEPHEQ